MSELKERLELFRSDNKDKSVFSESVNVMVLTDTEAKEILSLYERVETLDKEKADLEFYLNSSTGFEKLKELQQQNQRLRETLEKESAELAVRLSECYIKSNRRKRDLDKLQVESEGLLNEKIELQQQNQRLREASLNKEEIQVVQLVLSMSGYDFDGQLEMGDDRAYIVAESAMKKLEALKTDNNE